MGKSIQHLGGLLVAGILLLIYTLAGGSDMFKSKDKVDTSTDSSFSFNGKNIIITKHGACRMDCRQLRKEEILKVLNEGKINFKKSDKNDKPCPTYAYEGYTQDYQNARIVVAECDDSYKLVTAIDLGNKYDCDCY